VVGAFAFCVLGGWTLGALLQLWRFVPGLVLAELIFFAAPALVVLWRSRRGGPGCPPDFRAPRGVDAVRAGLLGALAAGLAVVAGVAVRRGLDLPLSGRGPEWPLVLALALPAPLAEELMFRPVVQRTLAAFWRPAAAVSATAVLFGLIHGSFLRFPETFLLGFLNGVVYLKSGNYWPCALFHAAANLAGLGLWSLAARAPLLFHPLTGLALAVPVLVLTWSWPPPPEARRWSWRAHLRWALFGPNAPPSGPPAGMRPAVVWGVGVAAMAVWVGWVTAGELKAGRAAREAEAGGPEVRQRDEWVLDTNAVITVRSRLEFERWPPRSETWVLALAYPEATLHGVTLAGEVFEPRPVGRGTYELRWPRPLPPPGTVEVYWEVPLAALEAPERGFRVRLQALVPVHAYALRLVLAEGCGYVFDRAPERPFDTIFSTSGQRPPRRDFGTCGLGLRRADEVPPTSPPAP
jgi:membrane protease YdiL (CAAX protease family)